MEVSHFMSHFVKQVFVPQTSLNTLAESVQIVRKAAEQVRLQKSPSCEVFLRLFRKSDSCLFQMRDMGLDLEYQLEGHLITPVTKALAETREKLLDAVRLRCAEDIWRPAKAPRSSLASLAPSTGKQ